MPLLRRDRNGQWQGYDLPLHRDRLFVVAAISGLALTVVGVATGHGWGSLWAIALFPLSAGVWLGIPRNVRRGWREGAATTGTGRRPRRGTGSSDS